MDSAVVAAADVADAAGPLEQRTLLAQMALLPMARRRLQALQVARRREDAAVAVVLDAAAQVVGLLLRRQARRSATMPVKWM